MSIGIFILELAMWFTTFLFGTKIGHFVLALITAIGIMSLLWLGLWFHDNQIRNEAILRFNQQQIVLVQKKQEEFDAATKRLQQATDEIKTKLKDANDKIDGVSEQMQGTLHQKLEGRDKPLSPYLDNFMKQLNSTDH
jgi:hypothetical protein